MADTDVNGTYSFVDARTGRGNAGASVLVEQNNHDIIFDMRARLAAINAGYYTAARLNTMTKNDMTYALRRESDPTGIR